MDRTSFSKWIEQIFATQEREPDCNLFMQILPQYVDLQVSGHDANLHLDEIEAHLRQCVRCSDLYLALYEAALTEVQDEAQPIEILSMEKVERTRTA